MLVQLKKDSQADYHYQNAKGRWEARVDGIQVRSKYGKTSWTIKAYAKEVARKFCNGS